MKLTTYLYRKYRHAYKVFTKADIEEVDHYLLDKGFALTGTCKSLSSVAVSYRHPTLNGCSVNVWCSPNCFAYISAYMDDGPAGRFMLKAPDKPIVHDWLGAIVGTVDGSLFEQPSHAETTMQVMARRKNGTRKYKGSKCSRRGEASVPRGHRVR